MSDVTLHPAKLIALYVPSAGAGWVLQSLGFPLPWLIGPLVLVAAVYGSGLLVETIPRSTRYGGQLIVAVQIGVYFTADAVGALAQLVPLLVSVAAMTLVAAAAVSVLSARATGRPVAQVFLSTLPFSPVEATVITERYGWPPGPIILSQILRIGIAVTTVPVILYAIDGWPTETADPGLSVGFSITDIVILVGIAGAGTVFFLRFDLTNPWFMGPLLATAAVSALGYQSPGFPMAILAVAQLVLGVWLGSAFRRAVFIEAGQQIGAILAATVAFLVLVSAGAAGLAAMFGQPWRVLVLGAVPGGITEMALTAKFLGVDVTLVTGLQMARYLLFVLAMPWLLRLFQLLERPPGRD